MKKHLNKLWAKIITFVGMTGAAVLFCMSFFSAWFYVEFWAMVVNVPAAIVFVPCFSFQLRSAGYWEGHENLYLTWLDRIPLDFYLAAAITRSVLEPRLLGKQMGIDPLVTLVTLYLGYRLWGVLGMLLAPLTAATAIRLSSLNAER